MKYLYIESDGTLRQSNEEPSSDDLRAIIDGELNVVKVENSGFVEAVVSNPDAGEDEDLTFDWSAVSDR